MDKNGLEIKRQIRAGRKNVQPTAQHFFPFVTICLSSQTKKSPKKLKKLKAGHSKTAEAPPKEKNEKVAGNCCARKRVFFPKIKQPSRRIRTKAAFSFLPAAKPSGHRTVRVVVVVVVGGTTLRS